MNAIGVRGGASTIKRGGVNAIEKMFAGRPLENAQEARFDDVVRRGVIVGGVSRSLRMCSKTGAGRHATTLWNFNVLFRKAADDELRLDREEEKIWIVYCENGHFDRSCSDRGSGVVTHVYSNFRAHQCGNRQ